MRAELSSAHDDDETIAARDALLQEVALYAERHGLGDARLIDQLRAFFYAATRGRADAQEAGEGLSRPT